MPSKVPYSLIDLLAHPSRPRRPAKIRCLKETSQLRPPIHSRLLSTSSRRLETSTTEQPRPRWSYTPERMTAPVTLKNRKPKNEFAVNESQEKLDAFYNKLLGDGGDKFLTDEVKWLAVTHKSFDQGRRGYNDRLAFLGKRIVNFQSSLHLLNRSDGTFYDPPDEYDREPFRHPGVDLLPRLTEENRLRITSKLRIATFAQNCGLADVLRWKPRKVENLYGSGADQALAQALYAIVGAVALQRGGEVAVRIVKDRILGQIDFS